MLRRLFLLTSLKKSCICNLRSPFFFAKIFRCSISVTCDKEHKSFIPPLKLQSWKWEYVPLLIIFHSTNEPPLREQSIWPQLRLLQCGLLCHLFHVWHRWKMLSKACAVHMGDVPGEMPWRMFPNTCTYKTRTQHFSLLGDVWYEIL